MKAIILMYMFSNLARDSVSLIFAVDKEFVYCEPGAIENLKAKATNNLIYLTWDPPVNSCEQIDYDIYVDETTKVNTSDTFYNFTGLKSCVEYTFSVSARHLDEQGPNVTISEKTPIPEVILQVENYKLEEMDVVLNVTWEPPREQEACVTHYELVVWDQDGTTNNYNTNKTYFEFKPKIYCMEYNIMLKAKVENKEGVSLTKVQKISGGITNPPKKYGDVVIAKTWATVNWETDSYKQNMCEIKQVVVKCEALKNENLEKDWIQWKAEVVVYVKDTSSRPPVFTNVTNLSEFTNYTCRGFIINSNGSSGPSMDIKFQTNEGVPSSPQFLTATEIANRSFFVKWEEPFKVPGILQKYSLVFRNIKPKHFIPDECVLYGKFYYYELPPDITEFHFMLAHPDFSYEVYVNASTRLGNGTASEIDVNTLSAAPEKPRHLNHTFDICPGMDYNVTAIISWLLPCNTNGELLAFHVEITAESSYDYEIQKPTNITVPANDPIEETSYEIKVENVKASYRYNIAIKAILVNSLQGEVDYLQFMSPDGYPGPPELLQPNEIKNTSFEVSWKEPEIKNGKLLNYRIKIKSMGPDYEISSDECFVDLSEYMSEVGVETTNFYFDKALPYHKYATVVQAKTSAGFGFDSDEIFVNTLEGIPEAIRRLTVDEYYEETETYNVKMEFTFLPPCHTYGILKNYYMFINGIRENYEDISHVVTFDGPIEINVSPEYNYSVGVVAKNEKYFGKFTYVNFKAPSGVPVIVDGVLKTPVTNGTNQATFFLPKNLFNEINGDILYYALIIGMFGLHENSTFGHWYNSQDTWPEIKNINNASHSYQLTPIFWNPFKGTSLTNITIYIGSEFCSSEEKYCNKPLQPDTKYALKVRGFTARGYRDSDILVFQTDPLESTSIAVILSAVFGSLAAVALIYFIFVLWRRKKIQIAHKPLATIKSKLPAPISAKQFLKYYEDLEVDGEKLKSNYALLNTKSGEFNLTMNTASLPENRKKNRYSNILPYDETRVKLIKDNSNSSDYINASYIKGHSGNVEYIATQGPLESTSSDFWKMVLQENVTVIAMLTQCIEQNKNKCFKYFPNDHENMQFDDGIEVRCANEINLGNYSVKTLYVKKDVVQKEVKHLHFMDWPDFGCPSGTYSMLQYYQNVRDLVNKRKGKILVHCSAGVGRTGTLIAIDIIIQDIEINRNINIFGTVLELRKQRINMVQTEKQYLYIHTCIRDFIENPTAESHDEIVSDPIYDNIDNAGRAFNKKLGESAF